MRNLIVRLKSPWDFMRLLRLGLGVLLIAQTFRHMDYMALSLGGILLLQAVFNAGCCGTSGCSTAPGPKREATRGTPGVTTYEEIK
jgi:hypothetical protein